MINSSRQAFSEKQKGWLVFIALAAILTCAAVLRLAHLRSIPGWYSDEGNFIDFAAQLSQGKWQNFCTSGAPHIDRLPVYMYLLAAGMRVFGIDIAVSRGLSAASAIASAGLLYLLVSPVCGKKLGFLGSAIYAVLPWAVAYNRLGLTYNLMSPLFLLTLLAAWNFIQKPSVKWLALAAVSAGLAFGTDYLGAAAILLAAGAWLLKGWRWLAGGAVALFLTMAVILAPPLWMAPKVFWQDVGMTLASRSGIVASGSIFLNLAINFTELLRRESWVFVGICGLFLLPDRRLRGLTLALTGVTLLAITRSFPPVGRSLHYLIHLFPLFALGMAVFFTQAARRAHQAILDLWQGLAGTLPWLARRARFWAAAQKVTLWLSMAFLFGGPALWMLMASAALAAGGNEFLFRGDNEHNLTPAAEAGEMIQYLTSHSQPDDLVLASPHLAWAAPTERKADFRNQQTYDNLLAGTSLNLPRERFLYPCGIEDATYVILDPLGRDFAPRVLSGMEGTIQEVESWPVVFQTDSLALYQNPAKSR